MRSSSMTGPLCVALGLLLAPRSLVLVGNGMGKAGDAFLLIVFSWLVLFLFTAASHGKAAAFFPGAAAEVESLRRAFGPVSAIVLPLAPRVVFTITVSTSLLAIAGYVFNEVFLNWFPNLGFSFCLLGFLLALNLARPRVFKAFQQLFVGIVVTGLFILIGAGLLGINATAPVFQVSEGSAIPFETILSGFILFVGFDLAAFSREWQPGSTWNPFRPMAAALLLAGILFILWGLVSARYVSADRLSETTVPHMVAARAILGQTGRMMMGIAVLAGVSAAVNGLFIAVPRMIRTLISANLLPSFLEPGGNRFTTPLFLAAGIAFMMGTGMAGEPILQVYIRGSLCLWLLYYGFVHLSLLRIGKTPEKETLLSGGPSSCVLQGLSAVLFSVVLLGLLWYDEDSGALIRMIATVLAVAAAGAYAWIRFGMKKK